MNTDRIKSLGEERSCDNCVLESGDFESRAVVSVIMATGEHPGCLDLNLCGSHLDTVQIPEESLPVGRREA